MLAASFLVGYVRFQLLEPSDHAAQVHEHFHRVPVGGLERAFCTEHVRELHDHERVNAVAVGLDQPLELLVCAQFDRAGSQCLVGLCVPDKRAAHEPVGLRNGDIVGRKHIISQSRASP